MSLQNGMHPEHKRISDEFLIAAVKEYEYDRIKLCMKKGADINTRDKDGYTPLMHAVIKASPNLVRAVLAHDPDLFVKTNGGSTAFDFIRNISSADSRKMVTDIMLGALPDTVRAEVEKPEDVSRLAVSNENAPAPKAAITAPKTASFGQKDAPKDAGGKKGFSL